MLNQLLFHVKNSSFFICFLLFFLVTGKVYSQSTELKNNTFKEESNLLTFVSEFHFKSYPTGEKKGYFTLNGEFESSVLKKISTELLKTSGINDITVFELDKINKNYRVFIQFTDSIVTDIWLNEKINEIVKSN